MKQLTLISSLILFALTSFAQQIEWASELVSRTSSLIGHDIDNQGNIYAIFSYSDTLWLDETNLLIPKKTSEAVLVKFNNKGKLGFYKKFTSFIPNEYLYIKDLKIDNKNRINIIGTFSKNLRIIPNDTTIVLSTSEKSSFFSAKLTLEGGYIDSKTIDNQLFKNISANCIFEKNRKINGNILYAKEYHGASSVIVFDEDYNFKWKNEKYNSNICKDKDGNYWVITFPHDSLINKGSNIKLNLIDIENGLPIKSNSLFKLNIKVIDFIQDDYMTFRIEEIDSENDLLLIGEYWGKLSYIENNNNNKFIENFNFHGKGCCEQAASKNGYFCRITKEGKIHWFDDKISNWSVLIPSEKDNQITIVNSGRFLKNTETKDFISNKKFANVRTFPRLASISNSNSFILAMLTDTLFNEIGGVFSTSGYKYKQKADKYNWIFAKFSTKATFVVENDFKSESFLIYPNPAKNFIRLNIEESTSNIIDELLIYNINGKLMIKNWDLSLQNQVNVENLENGLYLIKIKIGDKWFISKFNIVR